MNIGITSRFRYSFFSNGLNQNIVSLYEVLEGIGFSPFFIDFTDTKNGHKITVDPCLDGKKLFSLEEFVSNGCNIDLLIGAGIASDAALEKICLKKNPNCKAVALHYGNNLCTAIWDWISAKKMKGTYNNSVHGVYHESWISEHYSFQSEYIQSIEGTEVKIMPYIWTPRFLEADAAQNNFELDYVPTKKPNIAVMEPNLNFTKNFVPPFFTIRHILSTEPEIFNKAILFDTFKIACSEDKTLIKNQILSDPIFSKHLDRVVFDPRERTAAIFSRDNPLVLSHQHLNALNYTYLEALNYGYPLVHNSPFFRDYGYYYSDFNIIQAAEQTRLAIETHNDNLAEYKNRAQDVIWRYSPHNPANINKIKKLVLNIVQ